MIEQIDTITIRDLINNGKWSELREQLAHLSAPDLIDLLSDMKKPERVLVFRLLPRASATDVFADLDPISQNDLVSALTDEETRQLLGSLEPDDLTNLLEELPGRATQRLLNLLTPEDLAEARRLLGYPEESVGRLMTPHYVAVRPDWTIAKALEHIRSKGRDSETIGVVYVVDNQWKLLDALDLPKFILADPSNTVAEIMDESFVSLLASDDREQSVRLMQDYDLLVAPVVDSDGVLLGIVTIDDVLDVAQEEATEDFQKAAAVAPLRVSYRESGIWALYRKRVGWLAVLILVNLISSGIIALYEQTLAAAIALAFFIPLLIGTGGNAGAQSATLMIRALATGDLKAGEWFRTMSKELVVGVTLGITLGIGGFFLGTVRGGYEIGIIVGLTMMLIVTASNIVGMSLPFLLTKTGLDPAVASSPLITTLADALGLTIYFAVAVRVLGML